jgi:ribosomal protein S18 acetylase RimI-like enzyme
VTAPGAGGADPRPPTVRYVAFAPEHLDGIVALCAAEGWPSFPEDPARAARALAAPGVVTVVAVDDAAVLGFATVLSDGEIQAYLSLLVVASTARRAGIGRRLVELAARRAGGVRVDLLAEDGAEGFYETFPHRRKAGFRIDPD